MANSERRNSYTDAHGNMFMPMNVEGGSWQGETLPTHKIATVAIVLFSIFLIITYLKANGSGFLAYVILGGIWFLVSSICIRFIVFEEKFYYNMYQERKIHEVTTPKVFWDIAAIDNTEDGDIITFSDGRQGVIFKVERDTITGKAADFKEVHYDAISDFYRELVIKGFCWVQMNKMELAGQDPRLTELNKLVYKSDNKNLVKLMELEVGHIKNTTRKVLYESDYFLVYTMDSSRAEHLIQEVSECIYKLLDGAYVGYHILTEKEIGGFAVKEEFKVQYFNTTEALLLLHNTDANKVLPPFNITGITWDDNEEQTLNDKERNKLRKLTSGVINSASNNKELALKTTLYRKEIKNKVGIDFSHLSDTRKKSEKNIKQSYRDTDINNIYSDNEYIDL